MIEKGVLAFQSRCVIHGVVFVVPRLQCKCEVFGYHMLLVLPGKEIFCLLKLWVFFTFHRSIRFCQEPFLWVLSGMMILLGLKPRSSYIASSLRVRLMSRVWTMKIFYFMVRLAWTGRCQASLVVRGKIFSDRTPVPAILFSCM